MRNILIGFLAVLVSGVMVIEDAEARRLGGARSLGVQRSVTPPPARPQQQQAAPAGQQQQAGAQQAAPGAQQAAPGAAAAGGSRWMPIIGGLALGGMLGYLFAGNGLGGILLLALLAIGGVMLFRALARRSHRSAEMQYAGGGRVPVRMPVSSEAESVTPGRNAPAVPAGFDVNGFLRAAKTNFVKLQLANDSGDLDEIREFTTAEMFDALSADVRARGGAGQQTDVADLQAELLELKSEGGNHWASIHFSGQVRETPADAPQSFSEIWHLAKPADSSTGWLLAGIQQPH